MTCETWRPIDGFPGYEVSDAGRVRSLPRRNLQGAMRRGRVLKQDAVEGYCIVRLARDGVKIPKTVHSLVLEAFVEPRPAGLQTRHLNGVRNDNRRSNLRWGTQQENRADQKAHGTGIQGARNPKAKLTEASAAKVFELRAYGHSQQVIGARLGIHQTHVSTILRGKHWTQRTSVSQLSA